MYLEKVRFLSRYAPKRPISSVTIVSGDGFFDKAMIMKLGFVNAEYVADRWHLKDFGLQKMFGSSGYELLKSHFTAMIDSASATEFDKTLESARELLRARPNRSGEMETNLETFASQRQYYATYCL